LSVFGSLAWGLGWIAALIWALWPQDKSLIDPFITNGFGQSTLAGTGNLAAKLAELDNMLANGQITQTEYEALRKKALGI